MYNRLITNRHRVAYGRDQGVAFDEVRCSGRSTTIALEAVAKAIRNPQEWIPVVDHYSQATQIQHVDLAKKAMEIADKLFLMYFERDRNMIRSCHMTNNQLELK
jgi:hypothetical protein